MLPLFDRIGRLPIFLQDALDRGAVVLTANMRAARALEAAFAEDQRTRGILAWPRPRILDWNSWTASLWEQYARRHESAPMPLSSLQEHQLWQQVQGSDRDRVVAPGRMADLAQEAYGLLGSYRAHPLLLSATGSLFTETHEDAERFLAWAAAFDRLCRQHGWLPRSRLEETLVRGFTQAPDLLNPIPELCLVGFDRTTPAQAALLHALEAAGTRIHHYAPETPPAKPLLVRSKHQREELEACAWWCRAQLEEDSTRRIGVIAPDLGRVRADLDRVFRRILMPQTILWSGIPGRVSADPSLPYEFSLGASLATLPRVRAALLLLRWLTYPLPAAELTWLLTSGFIAASAADQMALARLDADLRKVGNTPEVSLSWLLESPRRHLPADLRARLLRLQARSLREKLLSSPAARGSSEHRASHAHWAELAPSLLSEAGWPGYREANSFAFQTGQRWARLLGELAELGFDGSQPTWSEFLRTLESHAHSVTFAAESSLAPIQILGAFESSGQSFDALWFLGADEEHWPAVGRAHPLLPAWLQREAKMPHASPEADWMLAQKATARIVQSAPVVVLSYPATDQTGQSVDLRISPLLPAYVAETTSASATAAPTLQPVTLEEVADDSGTLSWPSEQIAGGSEILKRQAACAFQSFAMRRLDAKPLEQTELGLDPAERGTQLHSVLERLWSAQQGDTQRLHTRDDLRRALADASVTTMLTHHIQAAFAPLLGARRGDRWTEAYLACEQQRVHDRLLDWLSCESERRPFTVEALEQKVDQITVGSLRLAVRLDRIDSLADGTHLLIDYKTGAVKTDAWMGERPEEPQLPIYALFGGVEDVSGVAFAQIRAEKTDLLARAENPAGTVSEKLGPVSEKNRLDDEIKDTWREAMLALSRQFVRGDAQVDPRDGAKTCKYCPLAGLCRVHATAALLEQGDTEEDDAEQADEDTAYA